MYKLHQQQQQQPVAATEPLPNAFNQKEVYAPQQKQHHWESSTSSTSSSSSRTCTQDMADKQGKYSQIARIRGCPSEDDVWLRLAQLVIPDAKIFVDIGSNKGFTAARFFELWSPELGLEAHSLHTALKRANPGGSKELTECGACNDCQDTGLGSFVPRLSRFCSLAAETTLDPNMQSQLTKQVSAFCQARKESYSPIFVYSFDGSPTMVKGVKLAQQYLLDQHKQNSQLRDVATLPQDRLPSQAQERFLLKHWTVEVAAFSNVFEPEKTMRFLVGTGETGHLLADTEVVEDGAVTMEVQILTVDHFIQREGLSHVDVLKIDTEGHDPMVLQGAQEVLRNHRVTLVIFEYNKMWNFEITSLREVVNTLFEGYACYLEGKNLLLKLTQQCWSDKLEMKKWSNVWCTSLHQSDGVALAAVFDSYSLAFL